MKKVLMVIANMGFRDEEYFQPKEIMENNGIEVKTAALKQEMAQGSKGGTAEVDVSIGSLLEEDDNINEYDGVAFVGGGGMVELVEDEKLQELARRFNAAGKIVAAICVAPILLAKAGLLSNKKATVFASPENIDSLVETGTEYVEQAIVIDGNIITADGPASAYEFGSTLTREFNSKII